MNLMSVENELFSYKHGENGTNLYHFRNDVWSPVKNPLNASKAFTHFVPLNENLLSYNVNPRIEKGSYLDPWRESINLMEYDLKNMTAQGLGKMENPSNETFFALPKNVLAAENSWKNCEPESSLLDGQSDCDEFSNETNKFAKSKLSRVIVKKLQNSNLVFPKYLNCADWDKKLLRNIWEIDNQSKLRAKNATSLFNEFCNNATDHDLVMILTNIYFE